MKNEKQNLLRLVAVPVMASVAAGSFWYAYREVNSWWWIELVLFIFLLNYSAWKFRLRKIEVD